MVLLLLIFLTIKDALKRAFMTIISTKRVKIGKRVKKGKTDQENSIFS